MKLGLLAMLLTLVFTVACNSGSGKQGADATALDAAADSSLDTSAGDALPVDLLATDSTDTTADTHAPDATVDTQAADTTADTQDAAADTTPQVSCTEYCKHLKECGLPFPTNCVTDCEAAAVAFLTCAKNAVDCPALAECQL